MENIYIYEEGRNGRNVWEICVIVFIYIYIYIYIK